MASLLSCTDQAFNFRDMFILGHTIAVNMHDDQLVFAYRKLAVRKDLSQPETAFPIEFVQHSKRGYNNIPTYGREDTGCVVLVDMSGCRDWEWYLNNTYDTNCQNDLLIVVLYVLGYRYYVMLYSSFLFPHHLSF